MLTDSVECAGDEEEGVADMAVRIGRPDSVRCLLAAEHQAVGR